MDSYPKRHSRKKRGAMDYYVITVFACMILFTLKMIHVFETQGAIPDTLCTCVFAALGGECGVLGWIKTSKNKYKDTNDSLG